MRFLTAARTDQFRRNKRPARVIALVDGFESAAAATTSKLRRAVLERAEGLARASPELAEVPSSIAGLVDQVAIAAYRTSDADLRAAIAAGYDEDMILEVIEAAALGASLARLDIGLAVIGEGA